MRIQGVDVTSVTSTVGDFALGTVVVSTDSSLAFKYVQLQNTTATVAGVAGDVVAYGAATGHSVSLVVTDKTDADTAPVGAGVLMATVAGVLAVAEYVWIQIKGPATLNTAIGGTPADGDQLMAGTTDLAVTKQLFAGTTPNIAAVGAYVGTGTDVSATLIACDFPW